MTSLDENSDGRTIELAESEVFEIVLTENPTTGHRWRLESNGAPVCAAVLDVYEPPDPTARGRGGTHRWRFRCERTGVADVILVLGRTWEKSGSGVRTFRIEVRAPHG